MRWSTVLLTCCLSAAALGQDWPQFRGPDGVGVADGDVPVTWSADENMLWQVDLPGPGSSSPIVVGDRVYLTCYTGYGTADGGDPADLKRHLMCLDLADGREIWRRSVDGVAEEDPYRGFITEHGYASSTPAADAEQVFAFFGKAGVVAFTAAGERLWQQDVGRESSNRRWGSAASPVLFGDLVIVNASEESQSLRAFDRQSGTQRWKAEAAGLELSYMTPMLVANPAGKPELVVAVPGELWGLDPATGEFLWFAEIDLPGNASPSLNAADGVVYAMGGRGGGSAAVRTGGAGDVTDSHVLWTGRNTSYVPSGVLVAGHLYWLNDNGIAYCVDAASGDATFKERVPMDGGGRGSRPAYASAVAAGDRIYAVTRKAGTVVFAADPNGFRLLATNTIAGDDSDFNATPAVAGGRMLLRSDKRLYCIGAR